MVMVDDNIVGYMPYERRSKGSAVFVPLESYFNYHIYDLSEQVEKVLISHIAEMRLRGNDWFSPADCCVVELWVDGDGMVVIPAEIKWEEINAKNEDKDLGKGHD